LRHEIFLFSLQFSATLINLAQYGQTSYENQAHRVNLPRIGECFTTIVGQSDWSRHCYWLSCLTQLLLPYIAQPTLHQLLLPKLVKVTLGGIFVKEFCYTSGNHGSVWANFCSPLKTAKLVQISIGLPKRASKNAATERISFLRER